MPTFERDGVELYFTDSGEGPAVLFHTGGGGDGRMWELAGYTTELDGFRQLLFDHRGHGRSGQPPGLPAHRIREYVSDVVAVLDVAQIERAVLIGYSSGANVALQLAVEHPDRCLALVAVGGPPRPDEDPDSGRRLASHLRQVGMRALMEQFSASEPEPAPAWLIENLAGTETEMFALQLEGWADAPSPWEVLPRVAAPTLIITGELEQGPPSALEDAVARLPAGEGFVSPGCAHLQNFWHAEVTAPVISSFLHRVIERA